MWIGPHEAIWLAVGLGGAEPPRPSSYRMTAALLATTGVEVVDVTITDLVEGVFIARLATSSGKGVDARPSDALNLALTLDVPVYASRRVLDLARDRRGSERVTGGDDHRILAAEAVAAQAADAGAALAATIVGP